MRAELSTALLRATAFARCSRPTISSMNAWWAGCSTTLTQPAANASAYTIHTSTTPDATHSHSTSPSAASASWVATSRRRRSWRSAIAPPHRPKRNTGANRKANVVPTAVPLPVSSSTSHASAIACIHPPVWEISSPPKNSR
jgi:hypothetical protein